MYLKRAEIQISQNQVSDITFPTTGQNTAVMLPTNTQNFNLKWRDTLLQALLTTLQGRANHSRFKIPSNQLRFQLVIQHLQEESSS